MIHIFQSSTHGDGTRHTLASVDGTNYRVVRCPNGHVVIERRITPRLPSKHWRMVRPTTKEFRAVCAALAQYQATQGDTP